MTGTTSAIMQNTKTLSACVDTVSSLVQLFCGQTRSVVKCFLCQGESVTYREFTNLTLPLPEHSNRSIMASDWSIQITWHEYWSLICYKFSERACESVWISISERRGLMSLNVIFANRREKWPRRQTLSSSLHSLSSTSAGEAFWSFKKQSEDLKHMTCSGFIKMECTLGRSKILSTLT